jgi:hypothetical protein
MGGAAVMRLSIKCFYVYTLLLLHDAGNLGMAEFDSHSDDKLMETAMVTAAGLEMAKAIDAVTAKKDASGPVECGLNRFSRGVERLERTNADDGITASKRRHSPRFHENDAAGFRRPAEFCDRHNHWIRHFMAGSDLTDRTRPLFSVRSERVITGFYCT